MRRRTLLQFGSLASLSGYAPGQPENAADLAASVLAPIPSLADLASDRMVHRFSDLFVPPGLQNEWGHAQAAKSVTGITEISFPPLACCGHPKMAWAPASVSTCELMVDHQLAASYPPPAGQVAYQWFPHCVVREMSIGGLAIRSRTFLPSKRRAVAQSITFRNVSGQERQLAAGFVLRAYVASVAKGQPWPGRNPGDSDDAATPLPLEGCVLFRAKDSRAFSVQGLFPLCREIEQRRVPHYLLTLGPGEQSELHFVNVIGEEEDQVLAEYRELQRNYSGAWEENEREFTRRVRAAFTPGNDVYSGSLPSLHTRSRALSRLYHTGFTNLLYSRVDSPASVIGPAYVTLRPRWAGTVTYLWDMMLTSFSLALLDPEVMRRLLEIWLTQDLANSYGTEYLTGKPNGPWYAVNDMAVLRCADSYLRLSGRLDWLDRKLEGRSVLDRLKAHALRWKQLDRRGAGLADYGTLTNLLEVVSTYTHEVAAMNAGNVYGMRFVASLLEKKGRSTEAAELRGEATQLARRIIDLLYVPGGTWQCGQPDGTFQPVRHAYDFLTVLDCMQADLGPKITREMCDFFWRELHSRTWMHALSPRDPDSSWNQRADHAWLGAYTAWPSMSAKALLRVETPARVAAWIRGLARSANQGPFGQAHMVESAAPPENGGALKCPPDQPYGNDWCEVSGGSFIDLILEGVFGAQPDLDGHLQVQSRLAAFDRNAFLKDFRCHGKLYRVDISGSVRTAGK